MRRTAFACREKGWDVLLCDSDPAALKRTQESIYPARYGKWDPRIKLSPVGEAPKEGFDLVIIGTPPESHLELSLETLRQSQPPKVLLIEKPLCPPSLEGCDELVRTATAAGTFVAVGYNHVLCENTRRAEEVLREGAIGTPLTIQARVLEHWQAFSRPIHGWMAPKTHTWVSPPGAAGLAGSTRTPLISGNISLRFSNSAG